MRVDFYLLGENKTPAQVVFALVNKGFQAGWRIGIHIDDSDFINTIDENLWTQDHNSFIPHKIIKTTRCQSSEEAVMLFHQAPDDINTLDYFINYTATTTSYHNPNGRIADIVQFEETAKTAGRERYMYYKQQDCELNHHNIL